MIPFPFNKNQFSFYVADHLLVSQLCTNPKSNRSLLSYLKVRCAAVHFMLSTNPSYDNRTIASILKMQIRTVQCLRAQLNAGPQVQRDPGLASEGVIRLCTLLSLPPLLPRPEPAGLLRLVIRQEHHQYDIPQHQS